MGSISSPDSDPSPRRQAAGSQAESSEGIQKSSVQGANPSTGNAQGVEPETGATGRESAANPPQAAAEPDAECLNIELHLPADVLAAFDETAAEADENDPAAARELIAINALTSHLTGLGYEFEEAEEEEEVVDAPDDESTQPRGRYRVLEEVTLKAEILFDIGTEIDSLASCIDMLYPVQGMLDTVEGMAFPGDDNGRRGLDQLGIWTQKLFGVELEQEMRECEKKDSVDVYRETMLIPEMVRDAVRHRLQRLSVFVGMVQGYEAE